MEKLKNFEFNKIPARYIQLTGLAVIGILELCTMLFGYNSCDEYALTFVRYMNLIAVLFVGMSIRSTLSTSARNLLIFGILFCSWPLLMQIRDFKFIFNPAHPHARFPYSTMLCEYLMLLPFACVADEKGKDCGLKIFGGMFVLVGLCYSVITILLQLDLLSPALKSFFIEQDNQRLYLLFHPNITARVLMLAVGMNLMFLCKTRKIWVKIVLAVFTALDYTCMSLTDSRSVILIACCLPGAVIFFLLFKRTWKTFLAGVLAAAVTAGLIFAGITGIYKLRFETYNDIDISQVTQMIEDAKKETGPSETVPVETASDETVPSATAPTETVSEETVPAETAPTEIDLQNAEKLIKDYSDRRSASDLGSFNGRTLIWKGMMKGFAENPRFLLTGVRDTQEFFDTYSPIYAPHAHNSWLEILLQLGIIGLAFALYLTYLAVRSCFSLLFFQKSSMYQKSVCILILCIMATECFEPFIFYALYPKNFINMLFMLCLGYAVYWYHHAEPLKAPKQ